MYAAPVTPVEPAGSPLIGPSGWVPVSAGSASTAAPVFGLMRKFSPVPVVTRTRSAAGLKSNPYPAEAGGRSTVVPPAVDSVIPPGVPTAVAAPVCGSMT